jgi:hypothetical protein
MKRLLTATILLMATFAALPVFGQSAKALNADGKLNRNPVRYIGARAFSDGRGVWLEWKTEIETKNLGFYIYRIVGAGEREMVSPALIPGAYMQAREEKITSGSYSFFDRPGDVNTVYVIESFHTGGQRYSSNPLQTQLVDDLETIAGVSSEQLDAQSRNAAPVILGNKSILPGDLALEVRQSSQAADPVTQRWVAAQPGVRIGVRETGLYRVPRADLQANGFDVNAPVERWQLYVNGVEQWINVGAGGDYIEFYGKPIDTIDSGTQIYFLVVGAQNGKRIGSTVRRRVGGSVQSQNYSQSFFKKERLFYKQDILNGDAENVFGTSYNESFPGTVNFNLTGVDFSAINSSLDITLQGITLTAHQTRIVLNGVELGVVTGSNYNPMNGHFDFPTSVLREGANTLVLTSFGQGDIGAFDQMKINFARLYRAEQNRLSFFVPNYKASYAENFASPNIRIFDTTNADAPLLISGLTVESSGGGYRVHLPSNRGRVLFAVEDSGILTAASISQNFPSTLSTAANEGALIIISHRDFLTPAEAWADYRRAQGLIVKVVNIEDIYDEFSFGVVNPDSIRSFLKYAKDEWQVKPNYTLIIGDATFDPRNYFGVGANYVPTRMVDTIYSETGSDETLADFNNDGLAEIAVGRIPARNAATVTLLFNKLTTFEQTVAQGLSRGAIFASDLPDGYDFEGLSNRLCQQLPATVPCIKINRALPNANAVLMGEMNNGRFIVNYSGHGNVGVWAASNFFSSTHAGQLSHSNKAIYTMLTCLNGYFINPTDSLSEVLLKNPNGGAVSTWASSGLTTPDVQEVMATRFYNQIAAGNITRIGDLIKDAKTTINFGRDVRLSWVLLGDPTMKVK